MAAQGAPKTTFRVKDESIVISNPVRGIICVQGETHLGEINEPAFCGNSNQFLRKFGSYHPDSKFPLYCLRLLDSGAKLWVSRAGEFTDPTDKTTVVGTKAETTFTVSTETVVMEATAVGAGYNSIAVTITSAASLLANAVDISISIPGVPGDFVVRDVPNTLDAQGIIDQNVRLKDALLHVQIKSITGFIPVGTFTLGATIAGVQDVSAIDAADYNGSLAGSTGWYSFNTVTDAFRIANIHQPDPVIDAGLDAFATYRLNNTSYPMRYHIGSPLGLSAAGMGAYREGTSPYSHTPLDNFLGHYVVDDVNINDPVEPSLRFDIPSIVDYLAIQSKNDIEAWPWYSPARQEVNKIIAPNNGVRLNLKAPANVADYDSLYPKQVNAIVQEDGRVKYHGNKSLLRNNNKILVKHNVADLMVYILRELPPLVKLGEFQPNDVQLWKETYRRVRPWIVDVLVANRAIKPTENVDWFWVGDQDANTPGDAEFNEQSNIDAGIYKTKFIFVPITATEFIVVDIVATDSNTLASIIQ